MSESNAVLVLSVFNSTGSHVIEGRTRLQKIIYILMKEDKIPFTLNYKPYFYGPYSEELSDTLRDLRSQNLIKEEIEIKGNGIYQYNYRLTELGIIFTERLSKIMKKAMPTVEKRIREKTIELSQQPLNDIIKKAKAIPI